MPHLFSLLLRAAERGPQRGMIVPDGNSRSSGHSFRDEDIVSFDAPAIGLASLLFAIQGDCEFSGAAARRGPTRCPNDEQRLSHS